VGVLLELLVPRRCVGCGRAGDVLCATCRGALRPLGPPRCARCGAATAWPVERCRECRGRRLAFDEARSAFVHAGPARALVAAWKEGGLRRLAVHAADLACGVLDVPEADAVVAVPPDDDRLLRRGHHPPDRLAHELANRWGIEHARLLVRTRPAPRQVGLPRDERRRNVRRLFAAERPPPRRVVLVDDVYTTGATAGAAAAALKAAGAERVQVVTFARAVR
jgi:predicted amidophosphoribosyltransferase